MPNITGLPDAYLKLYAKDLTDYQLRIACTPGLPALPAPAPDALADAFERWTEEETDRLRLNEEINRLREDFALVACESLLAQMNANALRDVVADLRAQLDAATAPPVAKKEAFPARALQRPTAKAGLHCGPFSEV